MLKRVRFVAQLVEHVTLNHGVEGSSPSEPTRSEAICEGRLFYYRVFYKGGQNLYNQISIYTICAQAQLADLVSPLQYG